jgi:Zn-dependent metalloprotease
MKRWLFLVVVLSLVSQRGLLAQQADIQVSPGAVSVRASTVAELRTWDAFVTAGDRGGTLRLVSVQRDPDFPTRVVERYDQFHNGVRIWGADIVRGSERGVPHSVFGELASPDLQLPTGAGLSLDEARTALLRLGGPDARLFVEPELVIVRLDSGDYRLAYTAVVSGNGEVDRVFGDAQTGVELLRYTEIQQQQAAVGTGTGALGDRKKLSVESRAGEFVAVDRLRPPTIQTFDLGGGQAGINLYEYVSDGGAVGDAYWARDADNLWTDPAVIDAQAHIGMVYDYFYKRFGRSGIDDRDGPINIITNVLSQEEALSNGVKYSLNANWCSWCFGGQGRIWFGNGLPSNWTYGGKSHTYYAGALDIVAHELTHAVTSHTSNLIYRNESGALNEAFSDMMGKSVEFFFHPHGSGIGEADYVIGKDVIRASRPGTRNGIRSMENPGLYGNPDHYSRLYRGTADRGGVHHNSGIPNQAFYLAIEGGTNRTSGVTVQGVGAANREQIEKVFFRAFTVHMPANATFSTARAVTARAAQELYGAGGAVERAVTEAWTAVGVFDATAMSTWTATIGAAPSGRYRTTYSVVTMAATGYYQAVLRWSDSDIDLDVLLSRNPYSGMLVRADSPKNMPEIICWPVRAGERYLLWVDNWTARSTSFTVEQYVTRTNCPTISALTTAAPGVNKDVGDAMRRLVSEDAR